MDASVSIPNVVKKQKLFEGKNLIVGDDRISSLPDEILHYILSFLDTEYVVGTSVLSTRWKYLWTSVPNLHFSQCWGDSKSFRSFVDRVLCLLDVPNIYKCFLSLNNTNDISQVRGWITTILAAKVQELNFKMYGESPHVLPDSFFTCESLKKLDLELKSVHLPTFTSFSSLKYLRLNDIGFSCDHSSHQVSFTFPSLEEFLLHECEWVNITVVNIFAPKLKRLYWLDYAMLRINRRRDCEIKVYAASLDTLYLSTVLSHELSLYNMSMLNKASVDVPSFSELHRAPTRLFRAICNIKKLNLSDSGAAILSRAVYSSDLLVFSSLIELRVYIANTIEFDEQCNVTARQLIHLLCHLPNVSSFCFDNGYNECFLEEDEDDHALEAMPESVLSHLKSVKLEWFHGSKKELYLVKILLNSASALEKMSIIPSQVSKYPKELLESAKALLMPPSDSKCVIEFF